jgi:molybdate transport system substrate-binding protein
MVCVLEPARRLSAALLALALLAGCADEPAPVRVAAASDLTAAFDELAPLFERARGHRVTVTYGATGMLSRQIREGAPFDVFASADASVIDDLVERGHCDGATQAPYARGRLALVSRPGLARPASVEALLEPRFTRIALANPEHAPYGRAARAALRHTGLWDRLEPRVVYGQNVRQALQFAESGNADVALVALALVQHAGQEHTLVAAARHPPIEQALVVCRHGASDMGGRAFADFVASPEGRVVMRRHGLLLPGESPEPPVP